MSPSASTQYRHAASIVLEFDRPFTHLKNLDALSGASPCPVVDTTHTTRRSSDTSIFSYSFMLISVHPAPRPLIAAWIPPATDSALPCGAQGSATAQTRQQKVPEPRSERLQGAARRSQLIGSTRWRGKRANTAAGMEGGTVCDPKSTMVLWRPSASGAAMARWIWQAAR